VLARRLTPALAAVVVAGLAASGCASQAVGVRVGDNTYSQADMDGELDAYGENETLFPPEQSNIHGELAGSYSQDFASRMVTQRVLYMLVEAVFDDRGLELTANDRDETENAIESQMGSEGLDALPGEYRELLVDDEARARLLIEELGEEGLNSAVVDVARSQDIEVSSQFGDWDDQQLQVVPPAGASPAPGSGSDSGSGSPSGSGSGSGPGATPSG
jgi:hypothetical protein